MVQNLVHGDYSKCTHAHTHKGNTFASNDPGILWSVAPYLWIKQHECFSKEEERFRRQISHQIRLKQKSHTLAKWSVIWQRTQPQKRDLEQPFKPSHVVSKFHIAAFTSRSKITKLKIKSTPTLNMNEKMVLAPVSTSTYSQVLGHIWELG